MTVILPTIHYKRGDVPAPLDVTLYKPTPEGSPPEVEDLTNASSIKFLLRRIGASVATVDASASVLGTPTLGMVRYTWATGNLDTSGKYRAEFEVTFVGGRKQTYPAEDYLPIVVSDDLNGA